MTRHDLEATNPKRLAKVMELGSEKSALWEPEELGAILRHQLGARVDADLGILDEGLAPKLARICSSASPAIATFGDLFHHPCPPVRLLELTKLFARASRHHPDHPLPGKIGIILYLTSIVVARTRCGARITKMDDRTLRSKLAKAIGENWLDESTRELLSRGVSTIDDQDSKTE